MNAGSLIASLNTKTLVFTVTAGRSGTKLLARLLGECLGIEAEHEPAPRCNYVLRSIIKAPEAALGWLATEKLPAILARARGPVYAETSHLLCKGFIEPMLALGLHPKFIILTRPASEVAQSLFQMNVIPERTMNGRLVLLGPTDPGVLALPQWQRFSDYQLCYWYAREIERRQTDYERLFEQCRLGAFRIQMVELLDWVSFRILSNFVAGEYRFAPNETVFESIKWTNQHPRSTSNGQVGDRELPFDIDEQEREVDLVLDRAGNTQRFIWRSELNGSAKSNPDLTSASFHAVSNRSEAIGRRPAK